MRPNLKNTFFKERKIDFFSFFSEELSLVCWEFYHSKALNLAKKKVLKFLADDTSIFSDMQRHRGEKKNRFTICDV